MSDLGTVSILVDVRGQPVVKELATDLNNVAAAETKVSAATQRVMEDFRRTREIMANVKRATDDTSTSFQRFSAKELQQASQRLNGLEQTLANTRQGMGQMGMGIQQVGYQVGDFLVQVQSGTNWMVAFGQQATQLVGILPSFAGSLGMSVGSVIAISSGLGIAIPLLTALGAAFMRTGEDSTKSVEKTMDAVDVLIKRTEEATARIRELETGTPKEEQAVLDEINNLEAQRISLVQEMLTKSYELQKIQSQTGEDYSYILEGYQENIAILNEEIASKQEIIRLDKERAQQQRDIEGSLKFSADYITLVAERALDTVEATDKMDFSTAISGAARLAEQLGISVGHASRIMALTGGRREVTFDPRDPNYDPIAAEMQKIKEDYGRVSPFDPSRQPKVSGGSGGGGGGRKRQEDLRREIELTKELTQAEKDRQSIIRSVDNALEDGFMSMVEGTKSVKDAFKSMARDIIKELYRVLVIQRMVGSITGGLDLFSGPSTGSFGLPFGGANASGGSMVTGKSYLVGENGPELVIPRHSGTVVNANQTAAMGGGSGGFTQNLSINVTGSDAAMVRTEVAKMIPQITNATKSAIIDAKQRGGQMAAAFR